MTDLNHKRDAACNELRCPRCGGETDIWQVDQAGHFNTRFECQNNDCGLVSPYFNTPTLALDWWVGAFRTCVVPVACGHVDCPCPDEKAGVVPVMWTSPRTK